MCKWLQHRMQSMFAEALWATNTCFRGRGWREGATRGGGFLEDISVFVKVGNETVNLFGLFTDGQLLVLD